MIENDYKITAYQALLSFSNNYQHLKRSSKIHSEHLDTLLYIHFSKQFITPNKLAAYFNVSKPRISVIINSLLEDNYIIKKDSTQDGRSQFLILSEQGLNEIHNFDPHYFSMIDRLVEKMGFGDFIQMIELIKQANKYL